MLSFYHHHSSFIKSTVNPKGIKKIAYAAALCFAFSQFRNVLKPIGYSSEFVVCNSLFGDFMETVRGLIDVSKGIIPRKAIRDYLQDTILGSVVMDPFDRRRIRSLIHSIFGQEFHKDDFAYCKDFVDSDRWQIPADLPLSSFIGFCQKLPNFPYCDGLLMLRNLANSIRDWNLSKWISRGIILLSATPLKTEKIFTMTKLESFLMSLPERLGASSLYKHRGPVVSVLRDEVSNFNDLLHEVHRTLAHSRDSRMSRSFVQGKVPKRWRKMASFHYSKSSTTFLSFLNDKRSYLMQFVKGASVSEVDASLFSNLKGLLLAFLVEGAAKRGLSLESAALEFTALAEGETALDSVFVLKGLWLISGSFSQNQLVVNRQSKICEAFPDLAVSIGKLSVKDTHRFMCPILRALPTTHTIEEYVDGEPKNVLWYVPLRTDNSQIELMAHATSLVCALPDAYHQ
jgi:hypothetical protein